MSRTSFERRLLRRSKQRSAELEEAREARRETDAMIAAAAEALAQTETRRYRCSAAYQEWLAAKQKYESLVFVWRDKAFRPALSLEELNRRNSEFWRRD